MQMKPKVVVPSNLTNSVNLGDISPLNPSTGFSPKNKSSALGKRKRLDKQEKEEDEDTDLKRPKKRQKLQKRKIVKLELLNPSYRDLILTYAPENNFDDFEFTRFEEFLGGVTRAISERVIMSESITRRLFRVLREYPELSRGDKEYDKKVYLRELTVDVLLKIIDNSSVTIPKVARQFPKFSVSELVSAISLAGKLRGCAGYFECYLSALQQQSYAWDNMEDEYNLLKLVVQGDSTSSRSVFKNVGVINVALMELFMASLDTQEYHMARKCMQFISLSLVCFPDTHSREKVVRAINPFLNDLSEVQLSLLFEGVDERVEVFFLESLLTMNFCIHVPEMGKSTSLQKIVRVYLRECPIKDFEDPLEISQFFQIVLKSIDVALRTEEGLKREDLEKWQRKMNRQLEKMKKAMKKNSVFEEEGGKKLKKLIRSLRTAIIVPRKKKKKKAPKKHKKKKK